MKGFRYEDIFATKHLEYLLVIAFLVLLIMFWRFLHKPAGKTFEATDMSLSSLTRWFHLPEGFYYHQGHSWVTEYGNLVKVGIDDFAQKMIGNINTLDIAPVGFSIEQGEVGWRFSVESKTISMLSPVNGEIVQINNKAFENPEIVNQDPYGEGWLMMVKPHNKDVSFKNLLTGKLARAWMDIDTETLMERMGGELGAVYQDGGTPVAGIAKILYPDDWNGAVKKFFLTEE